MHWEDIFVAGVGVFLGEPYSAEEAVRNGEYDAIEFEANGIASATVSELAPPEMAVRAAKAAVTRSGIDSADFALVYNSALWFQGIDMWPTASYVARFTVGDHVPAYDLQQQCNGAMAGVELAAAQLAGRPQASAALLTTADRFALPAIDRWRSESGIVYGDGATALVLSNRPNFAKLLSTATCVDNSLEEVLRGGPFYAAPKSDAPLKITERIVSYMGGNGAIRDAAMRLAQTAKNAVTQALIDAKTDMDDVKKVIIPAGGRAKMEWQSHQLLGITEDKTSWEFGRLNGHLGAGDQFAALNNMLEEGELAAGDKVLLVGGGAGFTCTCAVIELVDNPRP
jgi:3-oxoacyl-[acyl-carrier-protein] synthase-3